MTRNTHSTRASIDWPQIARDPQLALLTDLDGTLIPFAATPEEAGLDDAGAAVLRALIAEDVRVVGVTGRPRELVEPLQRRLPGAWWVAEHGGWFCDGPAWSCGTQRSDDLDALAERLGGLVAAYAGARLERKTASICMHWRLLAEDARAVLLDAADPIIEEWLETHPDHERMAGVAMLEVAPRTRHKGLAVGWLRARMPQARIVAIGDDITDEQMFGALGERDVAVAVGDRPSRADFRVQGIEQARLFLAWLHELRTGNARGQAPVRAVTAPVQARRTDLLVISNRMPSEQVDGRRREVRGLVAALGPALRGGNSMWLGWSGLEGSSAPQLTVDRTERPARARFDLPPHLRSKFYGGFCNRALWPMLHGFPGRVRFADDEWDAYVEANELYAELAAEQVDPNGSIWIHDYHLFLAAAALRRRGHRGPIGLFLHVPFPALDVFETLPWAEEMIEGLLAFDLIGFHTWHWTLNFLGTAQILGGARETQGQLSHPGGVTFTGVFPLGIDPEPFRFDHVVAPCAEIEGLKQSLRGRKLLLGVDRLDYSKGIPERLEAFERLLERCPALRGQVCFVQLSVPSRADVPEYAELRRRVEHLVGQINGRFAEADWTPVRYLYRSYGHEVLAQLYRAADVAVVTPLRDGMNLVAKEFVAAQDPDDPGVLVLSRFAGSAEELTSAVLTNPFHRDGLARDLERALAMPRDERVRRHAALRPVVFASTPAGWAKDFLAALERCRRPLRKLRLR